MIVVYKKKQNSSPKEISFNDEMNAKAWLDLNDVFCFNLYKIENNKRIWVDGGIR